MTDNPGTSSVQRVRPAFVSDERTMLEAWLDFHRATLLIKCEGLSDEQLKTASAPPSTLTLLGLVRHMTEVERGWFRDVVGGDSTPFYCTDDNDGGDFDDVADADVKRDFATFRAEIEDLRRLLPEHSLDDVETDADGRRIGLRWIYVHMIEEYARHNGHADLLRERIDGVAGD